MQHIQPTVMKILQRDLILGGGHAAHPEQRRDLRAGDIGITVQLVRGEADVAGGVRGMTNDVFERGHRAVLAVDHAQRLAMLIDDDPRIVLVGVAFRTPVEHHPFGGGERRDAVGIDAAVGIEAPGELVERGEGLAQCCFAERLRVVLDDVVASDRPCLILIGERRLLR